MAGLPIGVEECSAFAAKSGFQSIGEGVSMWRGAAFALAGEPECEGIARSRFQAAAVGRENRVR